LHRLPKWYNSLTRGIKKSERVGVLESVHGNGGYAVNLEQHPWKLSQLPRLVKDIASSTSHLHAISVNGSVNLYTDSDMSSVKVGICGVLSEFCWRLFVMVCLNEGLLMEVCKGWM